MEMFVKAHLISKYRNLNTNNMKKLIMIAMVLFGTGQLFAQNTTGEVTGEVLDDKKVAVYDAHVFIEDNGKKYQAKTGADGRFRISGIPAGTYMLNIRQLNDTMKDIVVNIPMDGIERLGVIEFIGGYSLLGAVTFSYDPNKVRLIGGDLPIKSLTSEEIMESAVRTDLKKLITSISTDVRQTDDGELVFRGARKGDMIYYIDGVKTRDSGTIPSVSIGRLQMYTGGLPAKYGDTLGGVVVIESKSYFDLYRAWQAEQLKAGKDI